VGNTWAIRESCGILPAAMSAEITSGRRGRPPRAETRASVRVEIVITAQERRELAELAAGEGRPVATMIREAVNEFVAERLERRRR